MDANTVTAICATVIAIVSLVVSVSQARATRMHDRLSVRPLLEFGFQRIGGGETGIELRNVGLGPAVILQTSMTLDGRRLGPWHNPALNTLRDSLQVRPRPRTLHTGQVIPAGFDAFLLYLEAYNPVSDDWFWELVRRRLRIEIRYESLYGGENYRVVSDARYEDRISARGVPPTCPEEPRQARPGTTARIAAGTDGVDGSDQRAMGKRVPTPS